MVEATRTRLNERVKAVLPRSVSVWKHGRIQSCMSHEKTNKQYVNIERESSPLCNEDPVSEQYTHTKLELFLDPDRITIHRTEARF